MWGDLDPLGIVFTQDTTNGLTAAATCSLKEFPLI